MNPFEELKVLQDALAREEARLKRAANNKADWDDPQEKLKYVRDLKRNARRRMLEKLCPGLRCPLCRSVKTNSRQWVVMDRIKIKDDRLPIQPKVAICRSCAMEKSWNRSPKESHQDGS